MLFKSYADIPANYRRVILDETGEKRVKRVPLEVCNEIIQEYQELETENERLKEFELQVQRTNGSIRVSKYSRLSDALVALDRELDYTTNQKSITAVITQAGRPIRGFLNGQILTPWSMYDC